jgi:hypothetical protein
MTGGVITGGATTGGTTGFSGTRAGLADMFEGTPLPFGALLCAATAPGTLANSASAHIRCDIRIPAFDFMEYALNPQDTATHCISAILANNSDEFDVNFAAIRKNSFGSNEVNCPSFASKRLLATVACKRSSLSRCHDHWS